MPSFVLCTFIPDPMILLFADAEEGDLGHRDRAEFG